MVFSHVPRIVAAVAPVSDEELLRRSARNREEVPVDSLSRMLRPGGAGEAELIEPGGKSGGGSVRRQCPAGDWQPVLKRGVGVTGPAGVFTAPVAIRFHVSVFPATALGPANVSFTEMIG